MNLKRAFIALGAMLLGVGLFGASPAMAQVTPTCVQMTNTSVYPTDGSHAFSCLPAGYTNPLPTTKAAIETAVFGGVNSLPTNSGTGNKLARDWMSSQGVTVFIFKNDAEADAWMSTHAPYSSTSAFSAPFKGCAKTVSDQSIMGIGQNIAIMIFAECTYTSTSAPNEDVRRAALHESGHGWEFAMASSKLIGRTSLISGSPAFTALLNEDISKITPVDWSTNPTFWTPAKKNSYICSVFGTTTATALEIFLGSPSDKVCSGSTPTGTYGSQTPYAIFHGRAPYFEVGLEQWAEQTKIKKDGVPSKILTTVDWAMGSNVAPRPIFKCSRFALLTFYDTGIAPTAAQLAAEGCPSTNTNFNFP